MCASVTPETAACSAHEIDLNQVMGLRRQCATHHQDIRLRFGRNACMAKKKHTHANEKPHKRNLNRCLLWRICGKLSILRYTNGTQITIERAVGGNNAHSTKYVFQRSRTNEASLKARSAIPRPRRTRVDNTTFPKLMSLD